MAVWGNYPCVRHTALLKKMTSHADQRPANSNWFEFLWSASPFSSILVQPDIPAAPCALQLFHPCTISHSLIPLRFLLPYTLFPHPAAHPSAFLLLHHSLTAHQHLSSGLQLYICTLMCSLVSLAPTRTCATQSVEQTVS